MKEEVKEIYFVIQSKPFSEEELFQQTIYHWLVLARLLSEPLWFQIDHDEKERFDFQKLSEKLSHLAKDQVKSTKWILSTEDYVFELYIDQGTVREDCVLSASLFLEKQPIIESYLIDKMIGNGLFAYIRDFLEYQYSNTSFLAEREFETLEEQRRLPLIFNDKKEKIVDCNQLSGYDIYFDKLVFTSCWKMWYGQPYFWTIPLQVFLGVQQVEQATTYQNQVVEITLFRDPFSWQHSANMKFSRSFRDQVGIDQLLWTNGTGVFREPVIEYIHSDQEIKVIHYQNRYLQPVIKRQATHFLTRELNYQTQSYEERSRFGHLQSQAFFPWKDEKQKKIVNYRIVNPEFSIDEGVRAYLFYIRQFLELNVTDDQYYSYLPVLRLYIPLSFIGKVPVHQLKEKLKDVSMASMKRNVHSLYLEFVKEKNRLCVEFISEDLFVQDQKKDIKGTKSN